MLKGTSSIGNSGKEISQLELALCIQRSLFVSKLDIIWHLGFS